MIDSSIKKEQQFYNSIGIKDWGKPIGDTPKDMAINLLNNFKQLNNKHEDFLYKYIKNKEMQKIVQILSEKNFMDKVFSSSEVENQREQIIDKYRYYSSEVPGVLNQEDVLTLDQIIEEYKNLERELSTTTDPNRSAEILKKQDTYNFKIYQIIEQMSKIPNSGFSFKKDLGAKLEQIMASGRSSNVKSGAWDDITSQQRGMGRMIALDIIESGAVDVVEYVLSMLTTAKRSRSFFKVPRDSDVRDIKVSQSGDNTFLTLTVKLISDDNNEDKIKEKKTRNSVFSRTDIDESLFKNMSSAILQTIIRVTKTNLFNEKNVFNETVDEIKELLIGNFIEFMRFVPKTDKTYTFEQYLSRLFSNKIGNAKTSTQGTLGEVIGTFLLNKIENGKSFWKGSSLNELQQQAHIDILVTLNKENIGIQVKQYNASPFEATFYDGTYNIFNNDFIRYFNNEQGISDMDQLEAIRYFSILGNHEKEILKFLSCYIPSLTRFKDFKAEKELKDVENNFFLYNFRLIPASVIFASLLIEYENTIDETKFFDLSNYYVEKGFYYFDTAGVDFENLLKVDNVLKKAHGGKIDYSRFIGVQGITVNLNKLLKT